MPVADIAGLKNVATDMFRELMANPGLKVWQDLGLAQVTTWANSIAAVSYTHLGALNSTASCLLTASGHSKEWMRSWVIQGV